MRSATKWVFLTAQLPPWPPMGSNSTATSPMGTTRPPESVRPEPMRTVGGNRPFNQQWASPGTGRMFFYVLPLVRCVGLDEFATTFRDVVGVFAISKPIQITARLGFKQDAPGVTDVFVRVGNPEVFAGIGKKVEFHGHEISAVRGDVLDAVTNQHRKIALWLS